MTKKEWVTVPCTKLSLETSREDEQPVLHKQLSIEMSLAPVTQNWEGYSCVNLEFNRSDPYFYFILRAE